MKRKAIVVLCIMAITIAISACGKKNKFDNSVEEVVTEAETGVADEAVEEISDFTGLALYALWALVGATFIFLLVILIAYIKKNKNQ